MRVAGFGCRSIAGVDSLQAALSVAQATLAMTHTTMISTSLSQNTIDALAGPRDKASQIAPLAAALGLPLILIDITTLQIQTTQTFSRYSQAKRGTGSVAEASALAAAGPDARLLVYRCISEDRLATCAIAEGVAT